MIVMGSRVSLLTALQAISIHMVTPPVGFLDQVALGTTPLGMATLVEPGLRNAPREPIQMLVLSPVTSTTTQLETWLVPASIDETIDVLKRKPLI